MGSWRILCFKKLTLEKVITNLFKGQNEANHNNN
jgi:hypothetical protein